jgi:hypothetical protein
MMPRGDYGTATTTRRLTPNNRPANGLILGYQNDFTTENHHPLSKRRPKINEGMSERKEPRYGTSFTSLIDRDLLRSSLLDILYQYESRLRMPVPTNLDSLVPYWSPTRKLGYVHTSQSTEPNQMNRAVDSLLQN